MTGVVQGSCYGFQPGCELSFEYLRGGGGEPFAVAELEGEPDNGDGVLVTEWTPIPDRRIGARLYADGPRYRLWVDGFGTFAVDPQAPSVGCSQSSSTSLMSCLRRSIPSASSDPKYWSSTSSGAGLRITWYWK